MLAVQETNKPLELTEDALFPVGDLWPWNFPQLKTRSISNDDSDSAGGRRVD